MGIQGLSKVIADHAPRAIQEHPITNYFGRKVAIDASTSIYQFLIAVRSMDSGVGGASSGIGANLMNAAGETTRTIRMMESGIKPVYVFDGKPPELKGKELAKRSERRKEAAEQFEAAKEAGDTALADRLVRRNVKVTAKHNDDCKRLLSLMGVPWIQAPGEAEAQCAALAQAGLVYAAGSEDMDTLTFGTSVLLRHLTFSEAKKLPISELHLDKVLEGLEMSMPQFIDLCILLGCDYCESIRGIGPHKAVTLLRQHGCIEGVLDAIDRLKYPVPDSWPYEEVRRLFSHPAILPPDDPQLAAIKWGMPDEDGLVDFMVRQNGFSEVRVRTAIEKIAKARRTAPQGRLDGYFKKAEGNSAGRKAGGKTGSRAGKSGVTSAGRASAKKAKTARQQ